MNPLEIIELVQQMSSLSPKLQGIVSGGWKNFTPENVNSLLPQLEPLLARLGAMVSPAAEEGVHAAIGATAAFLGGNNTKGVQIALNAYLKDVPGFVRLVEDGVAGQKTHDAIRLAQTKAGIPVDGWFGQVTAQAVGFVLK